MLLIPRPNFCSGPAQPTPKIATANKDSVATPTNGFYSGTNGTITWASFTIKVTKVPTFTHFNDGYFCQFISTSPAVPVHSAADILAADAHISGHPAAQRS